MRAWRSKCANVRPGLPPMPYNMPPQVLPPVRPPIATVPMSAPPPAPVSDAPLVEDDLLPMEEFAAPIPALAEAVVEAPPAPAAANHGPELATAQQLPLFPGLDPDSSEAPRRRKTK